MQVTSSGFNSVVNSSYRPLNTGVLIGWNKTLATGINYFTINTSLINGVDIIRGDANSFSPSFFDKYLYNDYTQQVKNWSVQRDIGQFPFGLIMAQADVELDNSSKMFLPGYDATIGSGILPGRPLKINVGMGLDNLQQFVGFTGQPELSITNRNCLLHAYDVMDYLNNYSFTSSSGTNYSGMMTNITTASAVSYYLGRLGFNSNQMNLDQSLASPIYYLNVTDRKFGNILQDLMYAEQGMLFADENGSINFWNRQHFNTTSGYGARFNLDYTNCISIDYSNAPIINDVRVVSKPREVVAQPVVIWQSISTTTVNANTSIDIFADFTDSDGSLPVIYITDPTFSNTVIGNSYYSLSCSNTSIASPQSFITVTSTYLFGTAYKITFANSSTSNIDITSIVLYGLPAKVVANIDKQYTDQNSISLYGVNPANNGQTFEIDNNYIQDDSTALGLANDIVTRYSQPNRHYNVEIFSNPALQIGDFGTINPDGLGNKSVWITGKTDKMNPEGNLTQILKLEEKILYNYFTINVSVIGSTDRIAL